MGKGYSTKTKGYEMKMSHLVNCGRALIKLDKLRSVINVDYSFTNLKWKVKIPWNFVPP